MQKVIMKQILSYLILTAALSILPSALFAWGKDGHTIIALIADDNLTSEAKTAVRQILGEESMADVSSWADFARRQPEYKWTSKMHYVNSPEGEKTIDMDRDCKKNNCVIGAIIDFRKTLEDPKADEKKRADALKFVIHFVGDVHQPMHAGNGKDYGGNDIKLEFNHNKTSLHTLWDTVMIRRNYIEPREFATQIEKSADKKLLKDLKAEKYNPLAWGNESRAYAVDFAYKVPKDGIITDEYYKKGMEITKEQFLKGGIRLANILNEVFKEKEENK